MNFNISRTLNWLWIVFCTVLTGVALYHVIANNQWNINHSTFLLCLVMLFGSITNQIDSANRDSKQKDELKAIRDELKTISALLKKKSIN